MRIFIFFLISCVVFVHASDTFPWEGLSNISLWLSSAAYCPTNYMDHNFIGPTEGFVPVAHIADNATDTHGYVGYLESQKKIFVVFRGSSSMANWYTNLDLRTIPYEACEGCLAHEGFSYAHAQIKDQVYDSVKLLQKRFPAYNIAVVGHSLGGALATLTALDLIHNDFPKDIQLVTFGQPRVGNEKFALYASGLLTNPIRMTHFRDCVPHAPYHQRFVHSAREWYESDVGDVKGCEGLEDPTCSFQWIYTTVSDHLVYLGLNIGCKYVSDDNERKVLLAQRHVEPEDSLEKMYLI
jgi:hypothetical protein